MISTHGQINEVIRERRDTIIIFLLAESAANASDVVARRRRRRREGKSLLACSAFSSIPLSYWKVFYIVERRPLTNI